MSAIGCVALVAGAALLLAGGLWVLVVLVVRAIADVPGGAPGCCGETMKLTAHRERR